MCNTNSVNRNHIGTRLIKYLAVLSLVGAYIIGNLNSQNDTERSIKESLPGKAIVKTNNMPDVYAVSDFRTNTPEGWFVISEQQGWGGPMELGIWINQHAEIEGLRVLKHRETPVFFNMLVKGNYFNQYAEKSITSLFRLGQDIDGVSGATVSSLAISQAVQKGAHYWGREHFDFAIERPAMEWQVGSNEFILIVFYAVVIISAIKKYRKMRTVTLIFSIVFLGFYLAAPISISSFGALLMGFVPSLQTNLFWWLLVIGAILMVVLTGKNLYCAWTCPFGGIQEFIGRMGGMNINVAPSITRLARIIVYTLFWLSFMIMFLKDNPAIGTFEPFAVMFSLKGIGVQWYLVSVAIFGSFLISRFWCRFFCPVGLVFKVLAKTKKQATNLLNLIPKTTYLKGSLHEKKLFQ